jgi:hypothetical protein
LGHCETLWEKKSTSKAQPELDVGRSTFDVGRSSPSNEMNFLHAIAPLNPFYSRLFPLHPIGFEIAYLLVSEFPQLICDLKGGNHV